MKITDAVAVIGKIEVTLGKASAEINKEVAALREKLAAAGDVPPELEDGLARLETLATNLDNVVPDDVTTDGEPPVITDPVTEQPTEEQAPE